MRLIMRSRMKTKMRIFWVVACFACGVVCTGTTAEDPTQKSYSPYPSPDDGYVTDIANLLTEAQEKQIEDWLYACEEENGFEMAVVTIGAIKDYPGTDNRSVEAFATGLFNQYGIGNMPKNDGVLLLVAVKDREARIELGDGYGSDRDKDAERIMQTVIVPEFRNGRYDRGILNGTQSILLKFAGKDVRPARQAPSAQSAVPVQKTQTTQHTTTSQHTQPIQNVRTIRNVRPGRSPSGHGPAAWLFILLILGVPVLVFLSVLRKVLNPRGHGMPEEGSGLINVDEQNDNQSVDDGYNRGFWNGLFAGGFGSRYGHGGLYDQGISFGGRSSRNSGIGFGSGFGDGHSGGSHHSGFGHSSGGFGGGFGGGHSRGSHHSGFGGGSSRGGGATGKW